MKKLLCLAASLSLALSACAVPGAVPTSPSTLADKTLVDEQAGTLATLAYTAASRAAALAIRTGVVTDKATIARIGQLDNQGFAAVQAVHNAYAAANAADVASALALLNQSVTGLVAASKGN